MKRLCNVNNQLIDNFFNKASKEVIINSQEPSYLDNETQSKDGTEYFGIEIKGERLFFSNLTDEKLTEILNNEYAKKTGLQTALNLINKDREIFETLEYTIDFDESEINIFIGLLFEN